MPLERLGCSGTVGWYVVLYLESMLAAHAAGAIHEVYQVEAEGENPCMLANRSGFLDVGTAVYGGAHVRAALACNGSTVINGVAGSIVPRPRINARNKGRVCGCCLCSCLTLDGGGGAPMWLSPIPALFCWCQGNVAYPPNICGNHQ